MWAEYEANMDERWADRRTELLSKVVESCYAGGRTNRWAGGLTDGLTNWRAELLYIFIYKVKYLRKIFNFF